MGSKAKNYYDYNYDDYYSVLLVAFLFSPFCEFLRQIPECDPANRKIWSMTVAAATIELFLFSRCLRDLPVGCHADDGVRFLISRIP